MLAARAVAEHPTLSPRPRRPWEFSDPGVLIDAVCGAQIDPVLLRAYERLFTANEERVAECSWSEREQVFTPARPHPGNVWLRVAIRAHLSGAGGSLWGAYPLLGLGPCRCVEAINAAEAAYRAAVAEHKAAVAKRRAVERRLPSAPPSSITKIAVSAELRTAVAEAKGAHSAIKAHRAAWHERKEQGHTCPGLGCRYFLLDLDAHHGEKDMGKLVSRLIGRAWHLGLHPVTFESKSKKGAHIFFFLDDVVTTAEAHAAGRLLARLAEIPKGRCDVIPSPGHPKGLGTLHVLPMSPLTQGGKLLDEGAMRGLLPQEVIARLIEADRRRSRAELVRRLAREADGDKPASSWPATEQQRAPTAPPRGEPQRRECERRRGERSPQPRPVTKVRPLSEEDEALWGVLCEDHPTLATQLRIDPRGKVGGRSERDAHLVGILRRQGMSTDGIIYLMLRQIENTKARERGIRYVTRLVEKQDDEARKIEARLAAARLAGTRLGSRGMSTCTTRWYRGREGVWGGEGQAQTDKVVAQFQQDQRVAPPREFNGQPNVFWRADVLQRLAACPTPAAAYVLGYLSHRQNAGRFDRRFFVSYRMLGKALALTRGTLQRAVKWIMEALADVIRVTPGVSHPVLRIANTYEFLGT